MSREYDEKVVSMKFDNSNFESNVQQSLSTLDKLKSSLNFTESTTSLNNLGKAVGDVSFDSMAEGLDTVSTRFSALDAISFTVLQNITNRVVDAGINIFKSFSVEPILSGWGQYGSKTQAVQTIMSATGLSIEEVNEQLDELIFYTDETSYSFADMVNNIGKFTSAGVDLQTSVTAMEGIANWAATSGQGVEGASRAMFNLSQALATGSVAMKDWQSIQSLNMNSTEFKQYVIDTAKELGTLSQNATTAKGTLVDTTTFDATLSEKWFTSDVLIKTLEKYGSFVKDIYEYVGENGGTASEAIAELSDGIDNIGTKSFKAAQEALSFSQAVTATRDAVKSKWAGIFETIFGDYEHAKILWTNVSNELWDIFAGPIDELGYSFKDAFSDKSGIDVNVWKDFTKNSGLSGENTKALVKEIKRLAIASGDLTSEDSFFNLLANGKLTNDYLTQAITNLSNGVVSASKEDTLNSYLTLADEIWSGKWGNGQERWDALTEAGYDWATAQKIVEKQYRGEEITIEDVNDVITENIELTDDQVKEFNKLLESGEDADSALYKVLNEPRLSTYEKVVQSIMNLFTAFNKIKDSITGAFNEIFPIDTVSTIQSIVDTFYNFTNSLIISDESAEKLKRTFKGVFAVFDIGWQIIKNVFSIIKSIFTPLDNVSGTFLDLTAGLGDILVKIDEALKSSSLLTNIVLMVKSALSKIATIFSTLFTAISNAFGFFTSGKEQNNLEKGMETILTPFSFLSKIVEYLSPLLSGGLAALGTLIGNIFGGISGVFDGTKITDFLSTLMQLFLAGGVVEFVTRAKWIVESFQWMLEGIGAVIEGFAFDYYAKALKNFAIAIGIIAAAIFVLSTIDSENLTKALLSIIILVEVMIKAFNRLFGSGLKPTSIKQAITNLMSAFTFSSSMSGMIKFAAAVGILAVALRILASLSWEDLAKGLIGITVLVGELTAVFVIVNKNSKKVPITGISCLISFAVALLGLAAVVRILAAMSWEDLAKGMSGITVLIAEILIAFSLIKKNILFKKANGISSDMGSLIAFAIGLIGLAAAVRILGSMPLENLAKGIASVTILLIELVAASKIMKGAGFSSGGASLIGFAIGLIGIAAAAKILGSMSWENLAKGMSFINVLIAEILVFSSIMNSEGMAGTFAAISASLIIFGIALLTIVPSLLAFSLISWESMAKGLVMIAGIFAVLGLAAQILAPLLPTMLQLAGVMALVGLSVALVGAGVLMLATGLAGLGGALALFTEGLSESIETLISMGPNLALLIINFIDSIATALDSAAVSVITIVKDLIAAACEAIIESAPTILGTLLSLLESLVEYAPQITESLFDLLIGAIDALGNKLPELLVAIGGFFGKLFNTAADSMASIDFSQLVDNIAKLVAISLGLAALGATGAVALKGGLVFAGVIAELGLIMVGIGLAVEKISGLQTTMENAIPIIELVGEFIGSLIGSIVGSFLGTSSSYLPDVGTNLSNFMTNVNGFITGASDIDTTVTDGIKNLSDAIVAITAANFIDSLGTFFAGKSLEDFGAKFGTLGTAVNNFVTNAGEMNETDVTSAANAANALANILNGLSGFREGGVLQFFTGKINFENVKNYLPILGTAVSNFIAGVGTIDETSVQYAGYGAEAVANVMKGLSGFREGGVLQWFSGSINFESIRTNLPILGATIKTFIDNTGEITESSAISAGNAGEALGKVMKALPKEGGAFQLFTGVVNFGNVGRYLPLLGTAINGFITNVGSITEESATSAGYASNAISVLMKALPKEGGVSQWFTGSINYDALQEDLPKLGSAINDFVGKTTGITSDSANNASTAATALGTLLTSLNGVEQTGGFQNVINWFTGTTNYDLLQTNLPKMGQAIADFATATSGISGTAATDAANAGTAIVGMINAFSGLKEGGVWEWFSGLFAGKSVSYDTLQEDLPKLGAAIVAFSTSVSSISDTSSTLNAATAGQALVSTVQTVSEITESDMGKVKTLGSTLTNFGYGLKHFDTAVTSINSEDILQISSNVESVIGILTSIDNNSYENVTAFTGAVDLITTALSSFASSLNISFYDEGFESITLFATGLSDGTSYVIGSVKNIMGAALGAFNSLPGNMRSVGVDCMIGLANGMLSQQGYVYNTSYQIAYRALQEAKDAVRSNSPSKAFAELGMNNDIGLANGMLEYADVVDNASKSVSKEALDSMQYYISQLYDTLNDNMDMNPTITPVLDFSEIQNGANAMNSILNKNGRIGLSGKLAGNISGEGIHKKSSSGTAYNDQNVLKSISDLGMRVDALNEALDGMVLTLDGDKVVGGLIKRINNSLGTINNRTRRGVM